MHSISYQVAYLILMIHFSIFPIITTILACNEGCHRLICTSCLELIIRTLFLNQTTKYHKRLGYVHSTTESMKCKAHLPTLITLPLIRCVSLQSHNEHKFCTENRAFNRFMQQSDSQVRFGGFWFQLRQQQAWYSTDSVVGYWMKSESQVRDTL